jgi:hypothetical protein
MTEKTAKVCICGETAMVGFELCVACHQHGAVIAAVERRLFARLLRAIHRMGHVLAPPDQVRALCALAEEFDWGQGTGAAAIVYEQAAREARRGEDATTEAVMQGIPRGFPPEVRKQLAAAIELRPLCLMCETHHKIGENCPPTPPRGGNGAAS